MLLLTAFAFVVGIGTAAPTLPEHFESDFTEYTAFRSQEAPPPYDNGVPPPPFKASRGKTFYDWSIKAMIEYRYDFCVNIFEFSNNFPCTFFNINMTTYLISNGTTHLPPCCVFGKPWHPPPPNFLSADVNASFEGRRPWNQEDAWWWIVKSIAPPTGPFHYSFSAPVGSKPAEVAVYSSFAFPGMSGWVQQSFFNQRAVKPPESTWKLPDMCLPIDQLPNCGFFSAKPYRFGH